MTFEYTFSLDQPIDQAWLTLMDIKRIAPCLPGASIESGEGPDYIGRIRVRLGPIELTYKGAIQVVKRDDVAHEATIDAAAKEIKGGGAAKASISLRAVAIERQSEVTVRSDFTVSGKPAQFGRGVMEDVGEKLMSEFASRLAGLLPPTVVPPDGAPKGTSSEIPLPVDSTLRQVDAIDIMGVAGWPIAKRLLLVLGLVVIAGLIYRFIRAH